MTMEILSENTAQKFKADVIRLEVLYALAGAHTLKLVTELEQ